MSLPPIAKGQYQGVVIGASAGGVEALSALLPALPPGMVAALFIVLHLPRERSSLLVDIFSPRCRLPVREAQDKEPVEPGTVYFAPPDYHLLVEPDRRLSLSSEEPVHFSRPAVDVLFESAADAFGAGLVGVVVTGANADGARGLRAVLAAGGVGLVQAPDTAAAAAMPRAALAANPGARPLPLDQIAARLRELGVTP